MKTKKPSQRRTIGTFARKGVARKDARKDIDKIKLDYGGYSGNGIHVCSAADMHPYNCYPDCCVHCLKVNDGRHNPKKCALCNY